MVALLAGGTVARADGPWRNADPSYRLELPRDHASHPDYKIEWWYYTGNLQAKDGRRFGYQLTFFRVGVDPAPRNPSKWAVRDLFMAHAAVTDVDGRRYRFADRLNRAGVGWAGAATDRFDVWNEDWRVTLDAQGRHVLTAAHDRLAIALLLEPGKPWVAQGEQGYSRKGSAPGNASHYYSLTRMPTAGRLVVDGEAFEVSGTSWMDHEFGSSFLEPEQVGWDWFSIQLDEGTDLMVFQLRRRDGRPDANSSGTLVFADGRTRALGEGDFTTDARRALAVARERRGVSRGLAPRDAGGVVVAVRAGGAAGPGAADRAVDRRHLLGGQHRGHGYVAWPPRGRPRLPGDDRLHGGADERGAAVNRGVRS